MKRLLYFCLGLAGFISLLCSIAASNVTNENLMKQGFLNYSQTAHLNVSPTRYGDYAKAIAQYLDGKTAAIQVTDPDSGEPENAFSDKENAHLADVRGIVSGLCELPYEECDYFVKAAVVMAVKHFDEAVAAFNAKMRGWTFDRRNRVEQSILLLAYVHYFFVEPDVDKGVVIDIAVKQAKVFLEDKDFKFVNAILDNVLVHAQ